MPLFPNPPFPSPLASEVQISGGAVTPRRALDRWAFPRAGGLAHVCVCGDSIPQGTFVNGTNGYLDGIVQRLQRSVGQNFGGLKGAGFLGLWRSGSALGYGNSANEWTVAGAWTQVGNGTTDLVPFRAVFSANGAANILTCTPQPNAAPRYVADMVTQAAATTVAAGSVGVHTNTFAGAGSLNVGDTSAFPASGAVVVGPFNTGTQYNVSIISYTGKDATHLTGCTLLNAIDRTLALGDVVSNKRVITSATAAFSATTDTGAGIYGANIPRNACIVAVSSATVAVMSQDAPAAGTAQQLGIQGQNVIPGGIQSVDIVWVDGPLNGAFSYSLDNGATWTAVASTAPANPTLKRTNVTTTLPNGNIKIRAADAGAVGHLTIQAGIILYSITSPATATGGIIVHSFCCDGKTLDGTTAGGSTTGFLSTGTADQLRIFDNAGDTTQQSLEPTLMIVLFSNDSDSVQNATLTVAQLQADLQTLINRVFGFCDLLVVLPYEQIRTSTTATQATIRAALAQTCIANGVAYIDLYQAWAAQGEQGFTAAANDGLMLDGAHPTLEGHADLAGRVARMLSVSAI